MVSEVRQLHLRAYRHQRLRLFRPRSASSLPHIPQRLTVRRRQFRCAPLRHSLRGA
jgi:hypothetical protein